MQSLRIKHTVSDFDRWKAVFDGDPVGRVAGGVRRYRVLRSTDSGTTTVMIDHDFGSRGEAERYLEGLRRLWGNIGDLIGAPEAMIADVVDEHSYPERAEEG
jgi:hypothetical protein